jgi:flagellar motor switch/type III secretory pathway protein FliN
VEKALTVRPYPWQALDSVPRDAPALLRDARQALARAVDVSKLAEVLGELIGERIRLEVSHPRVTVGDSISLVGPKALLTTADGAVRVQVELEGELSRTLIARILGRPLRPGDPRVPAPPELEGATLAIVMQVARRAHGHDGVLRALGAGALRIPPGERRLLWQATVWLGSDAYAAQAFVDLRRLTSGSMPIAARELASIGELPVSLGVVVARSSAEAIEIYSLEPGDVWMPGRGWLVAPAARGKAAGLDLVGRVLLASPSSERAWAGTLGEEGQIVVVGVERIPVDEEKALSDSDHDHDTATSEVVLDAPLVVRVEMGAVTLTVREWASLAPGDVIALGRRVSEPVLLRTAGLEIGRGELVDLDGELGVRIRERVKPT